MDTKGMVAKGKTTNRLNSQNSTKIPRPGIFKWRHSTLYQFRTLHKLVCFWCFFCGPHLPLAFQFVCGPEGGGPQTNWKVSGRFPFVWSRDTVQIVVFVGGLKLSETIGRIIAVERRVPEGGLRPKTWYQACTNVLPTLYRRFLNVVPTFLKRF